MNRPEKLLCGLAVAEILIVVAIGVSAAQQPSKPAATIDATKEAAPAASPDTILADEKLSLEWINLRLKATLARETAARIRKEAEDLDKQSEEMAKQADKKLEELRVAAKVPADYLGELRGNQVAFTRPPKPPAATPDTSKKEAAKQ